MITGYEIQTNSIRSEIEQCTGKAQEKGYELVFVTNSNRVKKEIEGMTGRKYKVLVLKPYEEMQKA